MNETELIIGVIGAAAGYLGVMRLMRDKPPAHRAENGQQPWI